jgi:hypothetical protein
MQETGILSVMARPRDYAIGVGGGGAMFSAYYYLMASLPGTGPDHNVCLIGGNLTAGNLFFGATFSVMTMMMLFGMYRLYQRRAFGARGASGASGMGLGVGLSFLTVFCAVCTIPVISVFGLSVGLGAFTTYNILFKTLSLSMMGFSLWMVDRQLKDTCEFCMD